MGPDHRDDVRNRDRRTFNRATESSDRRFEPPSEGKSILFRIALGLCIVLVLAKGYQWSMSKKVQRPAVVVPQAQQPQYAATPANEARTTAPQATSSPVLASAAVPVPVPAAVPAPAPAPAQPAADTPPPAPAVIEAARPQTGGTIYLCKDYGGRTFWAPNHCNELNALIDRIVSVPAGIPFPQQVQIAEERRRVLLDAPAPSVQTRAAASPAPGVPNKALCESLGARVTQLDGMARQPQSGPTQDWIRLERQKTREEQTRLRC